MEALLRRRSAILAVLVLAATGCGDDADDPRRILVNADAKRVGECDAERLALNEFK